MERNSRPFCSGFEASVPGTRNSANPCWARLVPGVPGVPGLRARIRDTHARTLRARLRATLTLFSRVHARYTRNTRNKPCVARLPDVPGTRNRPCEPGTAMTRKNLRADMPRVAEFIDAMREAFGRAPVDAAIRAGLDGQPSFWASENGIEIGVRPPGPGFPVSDTSPKGQP